MEDLAESTIDHARKLGAEFADLRAGMLAKLLWSPQLDDNRLIDEFRTGYYGPAGTHVRAYIDTIHDVMQAGRQPLGCYEEPNRKFMNIETLSKGSRPVSVPAAVSPPGYASAISSRSAAEWTSQASTF